MADVPPARRRLLGATLRRYRESAGYGLNDAARILECDRSKVMNRAENGGVFHGVYCAGNDATFVFLDNILSEVAKLFPGQYIHIGGDEVDKSNWRELRRLPGAHQK